MLDKHRNSPILRGMDGEGRSVGGKVILLVEDDLNDVLFIKRALKNGHIDLEVRHAHDGQEAIKYLSLSIERKEHYPMPCLVISDIKMPKVDGFGTLQWIRSHPQLAHLPVVMLSSSDRSEDVTRAAELGATHYVIKHPLFTALPMHVKPLLVMKGRQSI